MRRRKILKSWISLASAMVVLSGCVEVGVDATKVDTTIDTTQLKPEDTPQRKKAYYIDEPIVNVDYKCGRYQGKTDATGGFFFEDGAVCRFSIGSLKLREIDTYALSENISLIESDGVTAALLQSLDNDSMEDGTIDIDDRVIDFITQQNITKVPQSDSERTSLIESINEALQPSRPYVAKRENEAIKHLQETIKRYSNENILLTTPMDNENENGSNQEQKPKREDGNENSNNLDSNTPDLNNRDRDDLEIDNKTSGRHNTEVDTFREDSKESKDGTQNNNNTNYSTPKTDNRDDKKDIDKTREDSSDTTKNYTPEDNTKEENNNQDNNTQKREVDRVKPVIELIGQSSITLEVGDSYQEQGARASDNVDGDISDKIKIRGRVDTSKAGVYKIFYVVEDSSGNRARAKRVVTVKEKRVVDTTKPEITLKGGAEIKLTLGTTFKDPGATAIDDVDGDISDKIEVSGEVDSSKEGRYKLTYRVEDSAGNEAIASRVVVVIKEVERGKAELPTPPQLSDREVEEFLDAVNSIRAESQTCGDGKVMPAVSPLKWSDKLYKTAYSHSLDRDSNNLTGYPGWRGSGTSKDPVGYNKNKKSTYTERIPASGYASSKMAEVTGLYQKSILKSLKAYISNRNSTQACRDIMSPDLKDVGIAVVGKYFTVDMASPIVKKDGVINLKTFVVYDNSAIKKYGSVSAVKTRINHLFSAANEAYRNSTLKLHMEPVGFKKYTKTDGKKLQDSLVTLAQDDDYIYADRYGNRPNNLRNRAKAHHVMLMKGKDSNYGLCGLGYQLETTRAYEPQNRNFLGNMMFSAVYMNCFDRVAVHEIGHNFGLRHSHRQDGDENVKPYNYALGHGVEDVFVTIMAYKLNFGHAREPLIFSSPNYDCAESMPCGIPVGEPGEADAVRVIKHAAPIVKKLYDE